MNLNFEPNPNLASRVREGLVQGLSAVYVAFGRRLRTRLSTRGTGRIYRVAKGSSKGRNLRARGYHRASSPGAPPAPLTGYLRSSWSVKVARIPDNGLNDATQYLTVEHSPGRAFIEFGSKVPYAVFLERGTARMARRPYLEPTIALMKPDVASLMAASMKRALG